MKKRLDVLLVERGLAASREKAKLIIMAGEVYVNSQKEDKAGSMFAEDALIEIRSHALPFVSRGGFKLDKAVRTFGLVLEGLICLDIGASTGGFTDVMLQNRARRVYAIDVGYGQLDYRLRQDDRVVCMEKTNIRYVTPDDIPEKADFASVDVSFISLTKVLPAVKALLKEDAQLVCLIKPQFEAGREKVGKKGVVKDPLIHIEVVEKICSFCTEHGLALKNLSYSPIKGPEGNIEYLMQAEKTDRTDRMDPELYGRISRLVEEAHKELDKK
ncbi:MAG: TlyA family RNA methyltransferase [Blautia sp.]|nr:TlyA family RNA methyltransferase [Blautia sp.]